MSRFSVSNLLGKNRSKKAKLTGTNQSGLSLAGDRGAATPPKGLTSSKLSTVIAANSPLGPSSRAESVVEVLSSDNESLSSFYSTPLTENTSSRPKVDQSGNGDGKDERGEHDYAMVPDAAAKPSEEWLQLDIDGRDADDATGVVEERKRSADELAATCQEYEREIKLREEEGDKAQERLREVESELKTAQEELRTKSKEINTFADDVEYLTGQVHTLETDKAEIQIRLNSERTAHLAEIARLGNISDLERTSHEEVVADMSAQIAKLSKQTDEQRRCIAKLEDCLKDSQAGVDEREARIDHLESHLYDSQVRVDEQQESIKLLEAEVGESQKMVDKQEALISHLEAEIVGHQVKFDDQESRIHLLEKQLSESRTEVNNLHALNCDLETKLLHGEESAADAKDEEQSKDLQITILEQSQLSIAAQLIDVQSSLTSMERQNRMLMDQLRQQASEMAASKGLRRPPSSLSDRMSRGTSAMAGSSSTSRLDGAVRVIRMLNDEIYQTAASMTDQLESISREMSARFVAGDGQRAALAANLKSMLGTELVNDLSSRRSVLADDSPMFLMRVQTALQGCLIACSMRIITSWYPTEWEYGTFLATLFERIRGTDGPEKALQWRKTALKSCIPPTNLNEKLVTLFVGEINKIISLCGWNVKEKKMTELLARFVPKLSEIATLAVRLNNWASAGVLGEAECVIVEPGAMYDSSRMANDDDFRRKDRRRSARNTPPSEQVICTVGLGIQLSDNLDEEGSQLLLKPKVVLYEALF